MPRLTERGVLMAHRPQADEPPVRGATTDMGGGSGVKEYRIHYWEGQRQYTIVVGTNQPESLFNWYKKQYNRVRFEER